MVAQILHLGVSGIADDQGLDQALPALVLHPPMAGFYRRRQRLFEIKRHLARLARGTRLGPQAHDQHQR